ncbi:LacI family transcriptional regulator [Methylobacterium sp. 174MFSha1.1]|nr:LacI family transcriptional regulator [Methylobacterium sp. 174MFSha1.1]
MDTRATGIPAAAPDETGEWERGVAASDSKAGKAPTRRQTGAPTLSDVAHEAGVSPMTVSRVINADGKVRPGTRQRVERAIATLNYRPNISAQILAGVSQLRIGLLYSNPSAAYLNEFLVGCLGAASQAQAQLLVEICEPGQEGATAARVLSGGIDGLLLPPPLCDSEDVLAALVGSGLPAVRVGTWYAEPATGAVSIDGYAAARTMTAHIAALGHRRIGFIRGNPDQTASERRFLGYRDGMREAGLAVDPDLVAPGLFTYRSGLEAAEHLLARPEPPTAIFASNDDMAAATVAVALRRGLAVPDDLTVCGFDDTAIATTIWPELTTIRQPIREMSHAAMVLLLKAARACRLGQEPERTHIVLDHALIRRASDGPPR